MSQKELNIKKDTKRSKHIRKINGWGFCWKFSVRFNSWWADRFQWFPNLCRWTPTAGKMLHLSCFSGTFLSTFESCLCYSFGKILNALNFSITSALNHSISWSNPWFYLFLTNQHTWVGEFTWNWFLVLWDCWSLESFLVSVYLNKRVWMDWSWECCMSLKCWKNCRLFLLGCLSELWGLLNVCVGRGHFERSCFCFFSREFQCWVFA